MGGTRVRERSTRTPFSHYVYVLRCKDGSLYTGYTTDPERRLRQHNSGKASKYTRGRLPVVLAYLESLPSKNSALRREHALKGMTRSEKLLLLRHSVVRRTTYSSR
ncbi:MAG: GIY-YIG nuclease family protein [Thaumarchaeota archaeon]|nr:GIY-YIG nuclease family protein [Nitrososphaerota archaeon]